MSFNLIAIDLAYDIETLQSTLFFEKIVKGGSYINRK